MASPRKKDAAMATTSRQGRRHGVKPEQAFADLRATAEERARLLASAIPFDDRAWMRGAVSPTPEELSDLNDFLREREELRRYSIERQQQRLAEHGK
jgi:hypothetical protein